MMLSHFISLQRRLLPRQPLMGNVLTRIEAYRDGIGHSKRIDVLGVVGNPRRIAMPPAWIDLVDVGELPVDQATIA